MNMGTGGKWHVVRPGDTTSGLAHASGLAWETIWNHPNNDDLRTRRRKQNILNPGDRIFIPDMRGREESCATDQRHEFLRKNVPEKLNVRFLDSEGKPYANEPFLLTIGGRTSRGTLDGNGWLRTAISPGARSGRIEIGKSGDLAVYRLNIGDMDPLSETRGIQARLKNLGLYAGPLDGLDRKELRQAVIRFRKSHGLTESTRVDDEFRKKLEEQHRS